MVLFLLDVLKNHQTRGSPPATKVKPTSVSPLLLAGKLSLALQHKVPVLQKLRLDLNQLLADAMQVALQHYCVESCVHDVLMQKQHKQAPSKNKQPTNQPTNQPANQPTNQPDQSINSNKQTNKQTSKQTNKQTHKQQNKKSNNK